MTAQPKFDLSAVGELNLDLVMYGLPAEFELDREHLASDMRITLGSSSAIFAHNFALLGNRVGFNSASFALHGWLRAERIFPACGNMTGDRPG